MARPRSLKTPVRMTACNSCDSDYDTDLNDEGNLLHRLIDELEIS